MKHLRILLALVFVVGSLSACSRGGKETERGGGQSPGGRSSQQTQPGEEQRTGFPSTGATGGGGSQQQVQPGQEQRTAHPSQGAGGAGGSTQHQGQQQGITSGQGGAGGQQAYPAPNQ